MTSDKNKNHSQLQYSNESRKSYHSLKKGKKISKKINIKSQKQKVLNKCPLQISTKVKHNSPSKFFSSSSLNEKKRKRILSDHNQDIDSSSSLNICVGVSNSISSCQPKSQSSDKSLNSLLSNTTQQIKQEEIQVNDIQNNFISVSPSKKSSKEEYIKNRTNHEPILFIHNKWDILPNQDYNIFGDILIETDFVLDKKFSSQNHWKPPLNIEINPEKMIAKMNIGSYGTTMRDFSIIGNFMKMCNHKEIQSYASNLDKWQQICNKVILQKSSSSSIIKGNNNLHATSSDSLLDQDEIYAARLQEFENQCDKIISQLNNEGKIFSYSKKRYNNCTQNFEEYQYGFNQYLLAIMGCETEHLSTIIMRQGRPNFFDTKSRLKISQQLVMNYLNIGLSTSQQISVCPEQLQKVNLITFDDLQVPSQAFSYCTNFKTQKIEEQSFNLSSSNSSIQSGFSNLENTDYDFVLQIVELDIEAQHISTLISIREFNDHEQKLQDLKENIQYEFDIHVLLQKYYKPTANVSKTNYSTNIILEKFL